MSADFELRQFGHLPSAVVEQLFDIAPARWQARVGTREGLGARLGGTLYIPADRRNLSHDVMRAAAAGLTSVIIDLEDSVATGQHRVAYERLSQTLDDLSIAGPACVPALFIRLGSPDQLDEVVQRAVSIPAFSGLVLPKFTPRDVDQLARLAAVDRPLYAMPVVETPAMVDPTTRHAELDRVCASLEPWKELILAVRVGAVDIASALGLRRRAGLSVWDVPVLASVLADVAAAFTVRGFMVTGPAWDGLGRSSRDLSIAKRLLGGDHDGLMREVELDRDNAMFGKTSVHPDQAKIVNAMSVVTAEEWAEASQVLADPHAGVAGSPSGRRMIEPRPMQHWARKVALRAEAFGVLRPGRTDRDILENEVDW